MFTVDGITAPNQVCLESRKLSSEKNRILNY